MTILADVLFEKMIEEEKNNPSDDSKIDLNKLNIKITILTSRVEGNRFRYNKYYYCRIQYKDFSFNIGFHDSVFNYCCNKRLNKADVLYSALMDMRAYDCSLGVNDFMNEFGYDDYKKGLKIYNALSITSDNMHKMFTDEELETLDKIFENY